MLNLTKGQQEGADAFFDFLNSDSDTFALSGSAGTGKTFLLGQLCDRVMPEYKATCKLMGVEPQFDEIIFTATTNKAAEVLERSIGRDATTVHKLLKLKVREDFKTGKTYITKTDGTRPIKRTIVVIDESSMVDTPLYTILLAMAEGSKLVFVGDHAQMAPVGEEISPVYQHVDPKYHVTLTEPVRNADSQPLMDLCDQLRDSVETNVFHPIDPVPGAIEYLNDDGMNAAFKEYFLSGEEGRARVLTYTNSRVQFFNQGLRAMRGKPLDFQKGDVLVVASAYAQKGAILNVEREVEVLGISQHVEDGGYHNMGIMGESLLYREIEVQALTGARAIVKGRIPEKPHVLQMTIKALAKQKNWPEYFALKNAYLDLRDRDACTVYKSQGSTYDAVFLDLGNIGTSHDPEQVARMLFVGASRAKERVFLYGRLPGKYIGTRAA